MPHQCNSSSGNGRERGQTDSKRTAHLHQLLLIQWVVGDAEVVEMIAVSTANIRPTRGCEGMMHAAARGRVGHDIGSGTVAAALRRRQELVRGSAGGLQHRARVLRPRPVRVQEPVKRHPA